MYLLFSDLIPPAVRCRGSKAIAAYRRALEKGKTRDFRVPILLIGAARAGKSSLRKALLRGKFNKHEASKLGVDVDGPLDKDELMAWSTCQAFTNIVVSDLRTTQFEANQFLVPSWKPTKSPQPWASYLEKRDLLRKGSSQSKVSSLEELLSFVKDVQPPSGPFTDWLTLHLKGNAKYSIPF